MAPLVSVIIPTKNEAKNIAHCLKSIKTQSYGNIEIIVIDNFSKDKTIDIARKFTSNYYKHGNERSTQRNFGVKKSKGLYLLFIDADMNLTTNCLAQALKLCRKPNTIAAFIEKSKGNNFWEKSVAFERNLYQKEKILAGARLFPRKLFQKIGGFDEDLIAGEDWDITIRAQKTGAKLVFSKYPIIHQENIKNLSKFFKKKAYYSKNMLLYAKKHPEEFKKQSALGNRLKFYLKNWPYFLKNPIHAAGFIFLKTKVWYDWKTLKK